MSLPSSTDYLAPSVPSAVVTAFNDILVSLQAVATPGSGLDERRILSSFGEFASMLNWAFSHTHR